MALVAAALVGGGARAEPDADRLPWGWRFGIGAGASWLPMNSGTATLMAEAMAGIDLGHYSLRLSPRIQYFNIAEYPSWRLAVESLAIENVFHVTPLYEISLAPFVGYFSHVSTPPPCFDVCYGAPFSQETTLGGTVSPALFAFGPKRAFEAGAYAQIFVGTQDGYVFFGGYLGFRWFFGIW
jgi:hypothetical protein